jgi:HAD superfamily hydrolase (TIGR01490 family)
MRLISEGAYRKPWPAHLGWYLRGYTSAEADQVWYWVIENFMAQHWREETCQVLRQHKEQAHITVLVSGTPVPLLKRIAEKIGADHAVGTVLEIQDDHFTGRSIGPACIDIEKVNLTHQYMAQNNIQIDYPASFAYADSISDQYILESVGHPVATYPDQRLKALAIERSWQVFPPKSDHP